MAFAFFFFIFFINQILLIAQRILLKQVDYFAVFKLILLAIPQFLLFTFPFSCLAASSMVLGDFSANNEILAIRSSGISMKHVFLPIIILSMVISFVTYFTADVALPWSTKKYKELYAELMRDLPTLELSSNATNTIGDKVMVNQNVEGSTVYDILLFDTSSANTSQLLSSPKGEVSLYDLQNFIYQLDLEKPLILTSQQDGQWSLSQAEQAQFFLNFSGQITSLASALPSQLSIKELQKNIKVHGEALRRDEAAYREKYSQLQLEISHLAKQGEQNQIGATKAVQDYNDLVGQLDLLKLKKPINFYYQYYRAELHKKLALSTACFMLVFLTFSLSFFHVKHGRLIGFGLSMLFSVSYWYMLFFAQMQIFQLGINPALLIWSPNLVFFISGILMLVHSRRL